VRCLKDDSDGEDSKRVRTVLALAHGYFARLLPVLPSNEFFDEITGLVDIVLRRGNTKIGHEQSDLVA